MSITQHEQEPPSCHSTIDKACIGKVCIGIALVGEDIQVAARTGGRQIAQGSFPANQLGIRALLIYLTDWQAPMRLAVAAAGAAALNLALAVGTRHDREVFLVSAQVMHAVSDLACYAERTI